MKKIFVVLLLIIILGVGLTIWWNHGIAAVNPNNKTQVVFVVKQGEGVRDIASNLKDKNLINSPITFFLLTKRLGIDGQIEAGDFRLSPSMSEEDIAKILTHGILDIWVTIPEGLRSDEIADVLKTKLPQYNESWRAILDENEGYLFPDTYLIAKDATASTIVTQMRGNFDIKYAQASTAPTVKLSQNDAVTLASIVQREAITESDMKLVASVLENRLNINMALGSDVTLEYALGYQPQEKSWWKKDLTVNDLAIHSPYNTRINPGLPPTPICNPGSVALSAVFHPTKSNYLYYISDKNGKLHFAETLEQHNANIQKYGQ